MCLTLAVISVKLALNTHKGKLEEKGKILSFKQNKEAYPYREKKRKFPAIQLCKETNLA